MTQVYIYRTLASFVLMLALMNMSAQRMNVSIDWSAEVAANNGATDEASDLWFQGAYQSNIHPKLPEFGVKIPLSRTPDELEIVLRNPIYERIETQSWMNEIELPEKIAIKSRVNMMQKAPVAFVSFLPVFEKEGVLQRLISADLELKLTGTKKSKASSEFVDQSKLATGSWFRVPISKDGVYKLDRSYFQALGLNVNTLDPNTINIYGNDSGLLPYANSVFRHDDLQLKSTHFVGGGDGSFDAADHILFYAKGPHSWDYNSFRDEYQHSKHLYMDVAYVFIGIGVDPPARIGSASVISDASTHTISSFDDFCFS